VRAVWFYRNNATPRIIIRITLMFAAAEKNWASDYPRIFTVHPTLSRAFRVGNTT